MPQMISLRTSHSVLLVSGPRFIVLRRYLLITVEQLVYTLLGNQAWPLHGASKPFGYPQTTSTLSAELYDKYPSYIAPHPRMCSIR